MSRHGKDIQVLIDALESQGWRVEKLRNNHYCAYSPDGRSRVTMPYSPSEWRSFANTRAQLRRAGAVL